MNRGSAGKHVVALCAVALICFAGVSYFYSQLDRRLSRQPAERPSAAAEKQNPRPAAAEERDVTDPAVIGRRNVFLPFMADPNLDSLRPGNDGADFSPRLILVGTVIEYRGSNRAIIFDAETEKQVLVQEGDLLGNVGIKQINQHDVIVSRRGRDEILSISAARALAAGPMSNAVETDVTPGGDPAAADRGRLIEAPGSGSGSAAAERPTTLEYRSFGRVREGFIVKGRISSDS